MHWKEWTKKTDTDINGKHCYVYQKLVIYAADRKYLQQFSRLTTEKTNFKIFQDCKSEYLMYLMKYILCNKQYLGKVQTVFNIILNSHRKQQKDPNTILACKHF